MQVRKSFSPQYYSESYKANNPFKHILPLNLNISVSDDNKLNSLLSIPIMLNREHSGKERLKSL